MANKFNATLDKLKKTYADTFADINEAGVIKRMTLDSPQMNFIFGGGFAKGRMYELFGPESAGKSTICTYLAMQNQKHNKEKPMVMYIDFERSFDRNHAIEMGLDVSEDKFLFLQPYTGEDAFAIINEVIKEKESPVGLIVWDSIGATPTKSGMEEMFRATFGGVAKILSEGLKDIAPYLSKHEVSLVLINQERDLIGGFSPVPGAKSTPGGEARKFWASWRARVTRVEYIKEKGSSTGAVSGIKMKVRNVKSKIGVPCREALMELDFRTGFNSDNEYLSFIVALMCERKGPYYSNESWGMKVLGAPAVGKFLEEHPDIYAQAKIDVNALLCGETILDANNMEPDSEGIDAMTSEEKAWVDYANKVDPESDENFVEV